jgi:hypothetical protein
MSRPTKNITEEQKKEAKRLARKKYVLKNKTKVAKQISDWKENNKEKVSDFYKNYELTNLQPLCSKINRDVKRNKITK